MVAEKTWLKDISRVKTARERTNMAMKEYQNPLSGLPRFIVDQRST
jgi:hypothetical protein